MNNILKEKRICDLTTKELEFAYEQRLVQDGLKNIARKDVIEITPKYFDVLRQLARETASKN